MQDRRSAQNSLLCCVKSRLSFRLSISSQPPLGMAQNGKPLKGPGAGVY